MSDAPAYVVANFTIEDAETYRQYEKGFFPILKRHEGTFFTFDDNSVVTCCACPPVVTSALIVYWS